MESYSEVMKNLKNEKYDFITFLSGEKKNQVDIMASDYNNPGESVGGSAMGESYHIILFRDHKTDKDKYDDLDVFEAILVDPSEYITQLIPQGWYGIVGRKTTTSQDIMTRLVDNFNELNYNKD
jgi:hypothetical protein